MLLLATAFIVSLDTSSIRNKIPDREIYRAVNHEYYLRIRNLKL